MSSLHVILDTKPRAWRRPEVPGVYCAVIDIGDLNYDVDALKQSVEKLANALIEDIATHSVRDD